MPSAFLRVQYIRCTLATPKTRRRSPLVFHLVALVLFLFSPRVSCLILAPSLSSSHSRHVLPLIFSSPLEGLTARVDPPSLRLPAGSTTQTSSEQINTECREQDRTVILLGSVLEFIISLICSPCQCTGLCPTLRLKPLLFFTFGTHTLLSSRLLVRFCKLFTAPLVHL